MSLYAGGRHVYKKWELDVEGNRIASRCYERHEAMLQSTYLYNPDGSEILRYLRLDIDAEKTLPLWKNEKGVVCWQKIAQELRENFPDILRQIEWVTLSDSKMGLHIIVGIAPLPLREESQRTQFFCRKIQSDLIEIFNELGIGADRSGKGLKQDFSTFRNTENVIHHNRLLTKKIDVQRFFPSHHKEKFLNNLNRACNDALTALEIKNGYRLYRDLRVEPKIARLFLFVLGMYDIKHQNEEKFKQLAAKKGVSFTDDLPDEDESLLPQTIKNKQIPTKQITLKNSTQKLFHAALNTVELTLDEIAQIMQTNKRNIYKSFWEREEIKSLFYAKKTIEGALRITVKDTKTIAKRIQRARAILNYTPSSIKFNLIHPQYVQNGFRNTAIVSWALALKWHGVSKELAFVKVTNLVKDIPGYGNSSSCKKSQIKATLASVYRNQRETQGTHLGETLPEWLNVASLFIQQKKEGNIGTTISPSRSIQGALFSPPSKLTVMVHVHYSQGLSEDPQDILEKKVFCENKNQDFVFTTDKQLKKIRIVTYKYRVGFFAGNDLILCVVKNRHYKMTKVLEYIEKRILNREAKFDFLKDVIHMRHNAQEYQKFAMELYKEDTPFVYAQFICGEKKKFLERLEESDRRKAENLGIPYEEYIKRFKKEVYMSKDNPFFNDNTIPF